MFGIGTQANNALGSAAMFTVDGQGTFTTVYQGQSYGGSFLDTGSNALYFLDSRTTGLPLCPDTADFYCPAAPQSLSATHRGVNGTTGAVAFGVANADTLLGNLSFSVFSLLAGPKPGQLRLGLAFLLRAECVHGHRVAEHTDGFRSVLGVLTGCKRDSDCRGLFESARPESLLASTALDGPDQSGFSGAPSNRRFFGVIVAGMACVQMR